MYIYIYIYISHTYVRSHAQMHTYLPIYLPTCLAAIWPPSSYHQKAKEVLLTVIVFAPWDSLHNMHCICWTGLYSMHWNCMFTDGKRLGCAVIGVPKMAAWNPKHDVGLSWFICNRVQQNIMPDHAWPSISQWKLPCWVHFSSWGKTSYSAGDSVWNLSHTAWFNGRCFDRKGTHLYLLVVSWNGGSPSHHRFQY